MSNAQAPATVTAAITTLVQMAVDHAGITPGPVVSPGSLEDVGDNARVSVHLYRVSRNAALSEAPGCRPAPARGDLRRPAHRWRSTCTTCSAFRGNDDFEAQTMLAITAATLATTTTISEELLERTEDDHEEVLGNDLREAPERVRICPEELGLDDLNRVWSLYSSGAFVPTLALLAGPVLVESSAVPGSGLPVLRYGLRAAPLAAPRLDAVAGPLGPGAPVRAADPMPDLHLRGAALGARAGETVEVLVDGAPMGSVDHRRRRSPRGGGAGAAARHAPGAGASRRPSDRPCAVDDARRARQRGEAGQGAAHHHRPEPHHRRPDCRAVGHGHGERRPCGAGRAAGAAAARRRRHAHRSTRRCPRPPCPPHRPGASPSRSRTSLPAPTG